MRKELRGNLIAALIFIAAVIGWLFLIVHMITITFGGE